MAASPQRWLLEHHGSAHVVQITDTGLRRSIAWSLDDAQIATRTTSDERVVLDGGERGAVRARLPEFVGPARQVTWYPPDARLGARGSAEAGIGGIDFDPEPGSKAARRETSIREHPRRYATRRAAAATAGIVLPLLFLALLSRLDIPWPHLSIPWPDWNLSSIPWPSIPWPDIAIPWPDWRLPALPPWIGAVLEKSKYVWPVLVALVLARGEVKRRRRQDELEERSRQLPRAEDATRDTELSAPPSDGVDTIDAPVPRARPGSPERPADRGR